VKAFLKPFVPGALAARLRRELRLRRYFRQLRSWLCRGSHQRMITAGGQPAAATIPQPNAALTSAWQKSHGSANNEKLDSNFCVLRASKRQNTVTFLLHFFPFSDIMPIKGVLMRLPKEMIKHIADVIAINLEAKGLAKYDVPRDAVSTKIADTITANMVAEDKLNEEVKKLLAAHEAEISKGQMDYRKVFELTKQKLAKERGIVL
jgi:hypothetical protein